MNFIQKQSPMLGHDYSQWSLGRGRGSFAEFVRCDSLKKTLVEIAVYIPLQEVIFRSVAQVHFDV